MKTKKTSGYDSHLNNLVKNLGGFTRSSNDVRHCSRCNLPLNDASSWERGIGPICAKKDTHLFAKTIPANYAMASIHLLNVSADTLPESLQPVWTSLVGLVLEKMQSASQNTADNDYYITGEDCRLVCKVIDFMLSYKLPGDAKRDMIQVVRHLGFVGLAGVLSGESSTGDAELKFDNGKLMLTGSSNKAGFNAMRVIPGIVIPRKRGGGAYEAPAAQHEKFIAAVMEFWPCFDGKVDEIRTQCMEWIVANPVAVTKQLSVDPNKHVAKVMYRSATNEIVVSFDWLKTVSPRIVEEIKTINFRERRYDHTTRTWTVKADHRQKIVDLLTPHYNVEEGESASVNVPSVGTPSQASYGYRRPYRGYSSW